MTEHINDQDKHFGDEADFAVDADHAFVGDESTPFTSDSGPAADGEAAFEDARHDYVEGSEHRSSSEQIGQSLRKAAEDTAYATIGFVGLVADKAKEFYEDQKKQYADAHPEADAERGAKNFLAQLKEQLDKLMDDVNRGFRDLAERGRASSNVGEDIADKAERLADDVSDAADKAADDVADAADRAAENVEDFAEGLQQPSGE